ncbi:hypothetical protein D3C87_1960560 [compost metagenome]
MPVLAPAHQAALGRLYRERVLPLHRAMLQPGAGAAERKAAEEAMREAIAALEASLCQPSTSG